MSGPRLYAGGAVASAENPTPARSDVLVEGGVIRAVGVDLPDVDGVETVDCSGKILLPGLFDLHVHGCEPGLEARENLASMAQSALHGGITGVVLMPNTEPPIDTGNLASRVLEKGCLCEIEVETAGCITRNRGGEHLAAIAGLKEAGVVFLSDGSRSISDTLLLRHAMEYARNFDLPIAIQGDVPGLSTNGVLNEGATSYRLGLPGIPAVAEEIGIERDLRLASFVGHRIHVQQVTTARGVESVRRFREAGLHVTCEVSPHHLLFSDADVVGYDTNLKVKPPLRGEEDRAALQQALKDGVIDVIATNHSPHTDFAKNTDFMSAPFGIIGLETALPSLYDRLVSTGILGWDDLVRAFSAKPRQLLGKDPVTIEEGRPANLVVFDPGGSTVFRADALQSLSRNTPFLDQELRGRICHVLVGEEVLLNR